MHWWWESASNLMVWFLQDWFFIGKFNLCLMQHFFTKRINSLCHTQCIEPKWEILKSFNGMNPVDPWSSDFVSKGGDSETKQLESMHSPRHSASKHLLLSDPCIEKLHPEWQVHRKSFPLSNKCIEKKSLNDQCIENLGYDTCVPKISLGWC